MSVKTFFLCTLTVLVQSVLGQYIPTATVTSGNTVVTNNLNIANSGLGYGASNLANIGLGSANEGLAAISSGLVESGSNVIVGGLSGLNVASSGPLIVTSISPIGPSGLAVASENVIEGLLSVSGQLPYLSAVAFEGVFPTVGSGVATCGCGSGDIGIISESLPVAPVSNLPSGRSLLI